VDRPRRGDGLLTARGLLRRATVEQWQILERQHHASEPPGPDASARLLGLYLVVVLTLVVQEYAVAPTFKLLPDGWTRGEHRDLARRVWWAWFIAGSYVLPAGLYARYALGLRLRDVGLRLDGLRRHAWIYGAGFGLVLPFVIVASGTAGFLETYPFYDDAGDSWGGLALWELSYGSQFVALEFFFRGVMLFAAFRVIGPWAIPVMVIPYTMIHFGKPMPECVGAIVAGSALGIISLRTGSIYAGMLIHISVAWTMDALALWHEGSLPELLPW